jgi:hypothetical protein
MDMLLVACRFLMLSHEQTWFMDVVSARTIQRVLTVNIVKISTMTCHGNQQLESRQMHAKVRAVLLGAFKQIQNCCGETSWNETLKYFEWLI